MMLATPNDVRYANDVCLRAHRGKHHIIATYGSNIIFAKQMHHIAAGDASFEDIQGLCLDLFAKVWYNRLTDKYDLVEWRQMVVRMNKFFQRLFLFEKCEIKTKLSKQEILNRVTSFVDYEHTDYYGSVSECGFFIGEKNRKHFTGGHTQNSFAPVAKAKITEENGITSVSIVLRMHLMVMILFIPFYVVSLLTIVMFPLVWILLYFAFIKPTKKLKEQIENLLLESD